MKKIFLIIIAWCSFYCCKAQNIVAAEFFVDTDPGVGLASPITPSPSGANASFVASIPTTLLSPGFHFVGIRVKDDNGKWGLYENRGFYISSTTTNVSDIVAAEFFIDTDPGVGLASPITPSPSGANPNFVASIPTTLLSPGFHFVAIRTKDADGKWGLFENRGFYISSTTTNVSNIVAAEFFIDTDPGVGLASPITPSPSGANPSFVASIPTTLLSPGFHFVAIRTKDADGKWGLFENRGFYISSTTTNVSNIVAAEFFIDTDPGVGLASPITPSPSGANPSFVASIPTTLLSPGFHFVAIRTKDADGKWGLFENRGFYISSTTTNVSNIVAAEFFIDTDPGVGLASPITPSPSGANPSFVASIPTTLLSPGFHFVAIRTKDADGKWGLFENRGFYISTATTNMANIVAGEYFFDTDPGLGNGLAFNFTTPSNNVNENLLLNVPTATSQGDHLLVLRVKDANGFWSLMDTARTINISGTITTPLHFLSFTGQKVNNKSALSWVTENEVNTSHFEIERSSNGMVFEKIGTIASANFSGVHTYHFDDMQTLKGLNFYRLKQVDRDGSFTYSIILKILFNAYGKPMTIYPNPVVDYVQFDFEGKRNTIMINIYDAQGKQVMATNVKNQMPLRLNIKNLPKGMYTVQLSDGEIISNGSIIKQ